MADGNSPTAIFETLVSCEDYLTGRISELNTDKQNPQ